MRHNPDYLLDDEARVRALVADHPWATLVSGTTCGSVASHLPVLLEDGPELSVVSHLGRPDDELHELGRHAVLLIVEGPGGYVSPGWYGDGAALAVPTWNYVAAHLYGYPELLGPEETFDVLSATVDRFERVRPWPYRIDEGHARGIAHGVAGFRLRVTHWSAKAKLSQDKPAAIARNIIHALETDEQYADAALARETRRVWTSEETV
ncbi:FMN-binding negative transcriptional regulator [Nonomuraea roseola]|uniref:FMN-binding negative transcriptional regulator n=1 Tax=Nonomuraea roseola TaxID=46179 RepID=A0ABV5Q416_9ACTN